MRPQGLISKVLQDDINMGILNRQQGGTLRKRVDFPNPETQKALKNLIETLRNTFDLPQGESYEAIAEDAIAEAIQSPFTVSSTPLHDSIYSRALSICRSWSGDQEYEKTKESGISESDLEDAYQWIESSLVGVSPAQLKYGKDVAHKHHAEIAIAWKENKKLPIQAKWWIENKQNIRGALNKL